MKAKLFSKKEPLKISTKMAYIIKKKHGNKIN